MVVYRLLLRYNLFIQKNILSSSISKTYIHVCTFHGSIIIYTGQYSNSWNKYNKKKEKKKISVSHFWDRPVPIFSDVRFSYLALVQDKKKSRAFYRQMHAVQFMSTAPPPQFSMLFKINNSLYISFQSFINTQILTISHIIT